MSLNEAGMCFPQDRLSKYMDFRYEYEMWSRNRELQFVKLATLLLTLVNLFPSVDKLSDAQ